MASIEEVKGWIDDGKYPHVARTSDPLIVRVSKFSLLVNDTNFYAKIKNGLGYKGYLIYSSGLGTPILEESATSETEFLSNSAFKKAISDNGTDTGNKFYESTERVQTVLQNAAQSWLDTLELEIAKQPNDNAIKKAIDRLCWQLHYDITESHTNFPEVFKDNDFGDVQIDRYPMETQSWDGTTLKTAISDIAGLEFSGGQPRSYEITYNGYLYESAERLQKFDDHLTLGSRDSNKGAIKTFDNHLMLGLYNDSKGAITLFDEHLLKNSYDSDDGAFKKFNDALNDENSGSLIKIGTKLVPDDVGNKKYYSISECLRDEKNGSKEQAYSVAKSLREINQTSVSQATHDQTTLESTHFTDIEGRIGDTTFDDGAVSLVQRIGIFNCGDNRRSLFDTFGGDGGYANKANNALSNSIGYLSGTGLEGRLGVTSTDTRSIAQRLGYSSGSVESSIDGMKSSIGSPRKKDGTTGTESLFDAVYRHAGLLNVAGEGWDGYIDTHANSAVSNILNAINA